MENFTYKVDITKILLPSLAIIFCLPWLWNRRHLYRFALQFPGLLGLPFLGVFASIALPTNIYSAFEKFFQSCKHYTICIWLFSYPLILTAEPEFIEKVLSSPDLLNKSDNLYQPLLNYIGNGIAMSSDTKWRNNRKLINPSFNHKVLVNFLPVFQNAKNLALIKFDLLVGKGEHKLSVMLRRIGLCLSFETTMGKTMKEGDEVDENLIEQYHFARVAIRNQIALKFVNLAGIYAFYRKYLKSREFIRAHFAGLAKDKWICFNNSVNSNAIDISQDTLLTVKKTPNIFIEQVIELYQKGLLSWQDVLAESNTIVAASIETTANAIHSTLIMLAMHSDVQQKLYEELCSVFPEKDLQMSYEHMKQLPYLEMVINETLRLVPAIPIIGRQVVKDTQLTKELLLPKGLQILISIFNLQRRTDIWGPQAAQFNPDNFLPENFAGKHAYAFIPFSKGHRNCIGQRYANFALKTLLAGFVLNYRFTTSSKFEDIQFSQGISLEFVNEPGMEIYRR